MDIIKQYYDQEILISKYPQGWQCTIEVEVNDYCFILSPEEFYSSAKIAEDVAINEIRKFFACVAIFEFSEQMKNDGKITAKEYENIAHSLVNSELDL